MQRIRTRKTGGGASAMRVFHKYQAPLRWAVALVLVLATIQFASWMASPIFAAKGIANYAPLHTLLELIAIVVSALVFAVGWGGYDKERSGNFTVLACVFGGVAVLDFLHALSYQGMPDLITPSGPEKAIDFWLAARALSAVGLFAIAFLPWRKTCSTLARWTVLSSVLLLVGLVGWIGLLHPEWTPPTFVPGTGLTAFKINSEYVLCAIYAATALRFLQQMRVPQPYDVAGLFAAVCVMALSEFFFTLYSDVTDVFNLLGHIYKVIAYGFIFNSIFVDSIKVPYRRMYESRSILQAVIESIPLRVFWKDRESRYLGCNTLFAKDAGAAAVEDVIGDLDDRLVWREHAALYQADDQQVMLTTTPKLAYEEPQTNSSGEHIWLRTSKVPLVNAERDVIGVLGVYEDITRQKHDSHALRLTKAAIDKSKSAFFRLSSEGVILYINDYAEVTLGYSRDELIGKSVCDLGPDLPPSAWPPLWAMLKDTGMVHFETRHRRKDGVMFPVEVTGNYIAFDGEAYCFTFAQDITARKHAEHAQAKLTRALKLLSQCNALLVHAQSEPEILSDVCSLAVETGGYRMAWVGFAENDESKSVRTVAQAGVARSYLDHANLTWADTALGNGPTGAAIRAQETVINQDSLTNPNMAPWREASMRMGFLSSIALPLICEKRVLGALTMYAAEANAFAKEEVLLLEELATDLAYGIQTLRMRVKHDAAEKQLEFLAFHDPLTGLPNRVLLRDRFEQATAIANREHSGAAVLFLDLDNFKHVNDSLGHAVGDQLLMCAVQRMHTCIRDSDTISRQGGDEFIILLTNIHDASTPHSIAQKIIDAFAEPFELNDQSLTTSFSIGISLCPDDGWDFETILKQADIALYQAKDAGRNTYRFYSQQMNSDVMGNMQLQSQLHKAIKNQELVLHYQSQIDMLSGRVIGAEALLRWQHPTLGLVSPARFIPLAERSGLIIPIGEWVLQEACRQAQVWRANGQSPQLVMAVNLSSLQFKRGNLVETVTNALALSGLPAAQLELELTESILLQDMETVMKTLRRLKEMGVKLSIDDFGTGYSSLSYLKRLEVDKLKIDQSFVRDMVDDSGDAAIVKAIIQLGHTLQLTVIAEGVENEAQLEILRGLECDEIQGYLFGRPVPAPEFSAFCRH